MRYAIDTDMGLIVTLAREEHAMSAMSCIPFNEEEAARTVRFFMRAMGHTVIVTNGGYIAGMIQSMGFSAQKMAVEFAWYANDGSGMMLLQAFEKWGRAMGAVATVAHDYVGDGRLAKVLADRRDYTDLGSTLIRFAGDAK